MKKRASILVAVVVVLCGVQRLWVGEAFGADNLAAASPEQTSQQVETMLLGPAGFPPKETITKWAHDVHIGLISDHAISADLWGRFGRYVSEAQRASGRRIFIFGKDAGFVVVLSENTQQDVVNHANVLSTFFDSMAVYQKYFGDYEDKKQTCSLRVKLGPDNHIYAFLLFLSVSADRDPKYIDECLRRGVLTGLGVVRALDDTLDPPNERGGLTQLDVLSLKVLYDPALVLGADKNEISKQITRLVSSMAK